MVVTQFLTSDLPHPLNFSYFDIIAFIAANLSNFISISSQKNMTFIQVLPTVSQLSHQDKLRLIHFLLLAVAKEEGCSLETSDSENTLLEQLAATDAIVWSPQTDSQSIQALSNLLATAQEQANA